MTSTTKQLEVAAHWLREAAKLTMLLGGKDDHWQFSRVADECERVAKHTVKRAAYVNDVDA